MRKKLQAFIAILLMAALLVACGATNTPAPAATTAAPAATTAAAVATTAAAPAATTAAAPAATTAAAVATTAAPVATTAAAIATTAAATAAPGGAIKEYDAGGVKLIDPRPNIKLAQGGKKGGTLKLALTGDANSLHPYLTSDNTSTTLQAYLYGAALVLTDPGSGLPAPDFRVIDAVKVTPDKLTYTFTLKDGLKWSDGKPITSEDYAWTYKMALDPANKWPYIEDYADLIDTVTAPDPKTVVFKFKEVNIYAISKAGTEPLPKHIWDGKDWGDTTKNPSIDTPTVVSGPWKLKEWKRDQYVTFERNDASTIHPVPLLDTITYEIVKQTAVQVQKFKAGELDVVGVSPTDYDEAKKATNGTLSEYYTPNLGFDYVGFNFRRTYLQDPELRKALAYATPQKDIIDKLQFGLAQPTYSTVPSSASIYNPNTPKYEFSLDKAKDVLTKAGYKIEGGKLKDKTGKEIPKLKILFNTGNRVREGIATIVQQYWKEIGLEVEQVPLEFQTYLKQIKSEPFDYDFMVLGWTGGADFETFDQVWSGIPALNSGAWQTETQKKVVALYKQAQSEFDFNKRKEIMGQVQVLEATDLPYIFLYKGKAVTGISNKAQISPLQPTGYAYNLRVDWSLK